MKKLSIIKEDLKSKLGHPYIEHSWDSSDTNSFIKMSFLEHTSAASEHYEITFDKENNLFYISLHYENESGHNEFEKFIDQNTNKEFIKKNKNGKKIIIKGKG